MREYNKEMPGAMNVDTKVAKEVIRLRIAQMIVNESYKNKEFSIPIHLAFGHESIAVAISAVMEDADRIVLSHRNIHYNLARSPSFKSILDEYFLREDGIGQGRMGSMNLANEQAGIVYTSSILGNNLGVAAGFALGQKVKEEDGITIVVTGDGAMEEGAFYESMSFLKSQNLGALIIVEDNKWSLATQIHERRCDIRLDKFAEVFGADILTLKGNDPYKYISELTRARTQALEEKIPIIVEVELKTLGDWCMKTDEFPDGKYINYHAGSAPTVELSTWPLLREDNGDPVFVLQGYFSAEELKEMCEKELQHLQEEIR